MTKYAKNYTDHAIAVWDLADVTYAGTRYDRNPFRDSATGLSDRYVAGATFTLGTAAPQLIHVSDNDNTFNDGDTSQVLTNTTTLNGDTEAAGERFTPEYAYRVRPEGGTAADDIIIYAAEFGGNDVNSLAATAPLEAGVTYTFIENVTNYPTVAYDQLVSTVAPVQDGVVDGTDAAEEMGLGYTDEQTDMITTGDDVIVANEGDDTVCADDGDDVIYGGDTEVGGEVTVDLIDATSFMQWFYTDLVIEEFNLDGFVIEGVALADIEIGGVRLGDLDLSGATIGDLILGEGPLAGLIDGNMDNITLNGLPIKEAYFEVKKALGACDDDADKDALIAQFSAQIMPALAGIKLNLSQDATPAVVDIDDRNGSFEYGERKQNIDNNELFQDATRAAPGASFIVRPEGGTEADDVTIYLSAFDTTVVGFVSDKPLVLTQNYCFVGLGDMQPSVDYAELANTYFEGPLTTVEDGTDMNSGDDLLKGEGGNDTIYGQDGNDTIEGGEGADLVYGGDDCDVIIVSSQEDGAGDVAHGGAGGKDHDILDLTGAGEVTIDATTDSDGNGQDGTVTFANGTTMTFTNIEEIILDAPVVTADGCVDGADEAENMVVGFSDAQGDLITDGDDLIKGNAGNDTIRAGRGDDTLDGGDDRDLLVGQAGDDVINGGNDRDTINGGSGEDVINGGNDNDFLNGGFGADIINGNDDRDIIRSTSALQSNGDVVDGGAGGVDFDTLDLRGAGTIRIVDQVADSNGNGTDGTIEFLSATGEVVSTMSYAEIERIRADEIVTEEPVNPSNGCVDGAETSENMVVGYSDTQGDLITNGDDVIKGNAGDDTIRAGAGDDTVDGGDDCDLLVGQAGDDVINGGGHRDTINGGSGEDTLNGGEGNDFLNGSHGADVINGGDDRDTIRATTAAQANGDVVDGGAGGRDLDTLDLRGAGLVRLVDQKIDSDGNGFDGSIEFVSATGAVTATMAYTNIERFRFDGEYVEPATTLGRVTFEVVDDFQNPTALGDDNRDDAYALKLLTAPTDVLTGFSTDMAYCLAVRAPLDTDAAFDEINILNGELLLATTENAELVRDQSANEPLNILSGVGVNGEAAVENMDLINWILNQDWAETYNGDGAGEAYTDTEVQYAIWALTNGNDAETTTDAATWANAREIADLAADNGEGYTGGEYVGVIVEPTDNGDLAGINTQPFIIAVDADFLA